MATRAGGSPKTDSARRPAPTRPKTKRPLWFRATMSFLLVGLIAGVTMGIAILGYLFTMRKEAERLLATLGDRIRFDATRRSVIVAKDGRVLYEIQPDKRQPLTLSEVPLVVRNAILAAEDRRFYSHGAVDYWSVGRIVFVASQKGRATQGGSTITMQLAKLLYSDQARTIKRKLQDVAIAEEMEKRLTKDQILALYLNTAYFGEGATGIAAAARTYFGKPVAELDAAEAAMLARSVRRPSDQNPRKSYEVALRNGRDVLGIMRDEGWIAGEEYGRAMAERPKLASTASSRSVKLLRAPYFVASVLAELRSRGIDIGSGGYTVYTTLDADLQKRAEVAVRNIVRDYRGQGVTTAAFLLTDRDGKILAEVGGPDYEKSRFNVVTQSALQPGSAFKPILYATALQTGKITADSMLSNAPFRNEIRLGRNRYYRPKNSGRNGWGSEVSLRTAFAYSINIPAVRTIMATGPRVVANEAQTAFGFPNPGGRWIPAVPSLALGTLSVTPLAMAEAYSVFMTGGTRVRPYGIDRVIDPDGELAFRTLPSRVETGLRPDVTRTVDALMQAVVQSGTGKEAASIPDARGKTGTTNDAKDAWFCGYAQNLIGIGWVGNSRVVNGRVRRLPMADGVFGGTVTVRMWRDVMSLATQRYGTARTDPPVAESPGRRRRRSDGPLITTEDRAPAEAANVTIDDSAGGQALGSSPSSPPDSGPSNPVSDPPTSASAASAGSAPTRRPTEDPLVPPRLEPDRKRHPEPPASEATVTAEVCADTGALATAYCPETVTRSFRRSERPRRRCSVHRGG